MRIFFIFILLFTLITKDIDSSIGNFTNTVITGPEQRDATQAITTLAWINTGLLGLLVANTIQPAVRYCVVRTYSCMAGRCGIKQRRRKLRQKFITAGYSPKFVSFLLRNTNEITDGIDGDFRLFELSNETYHYSTTGIATASLNLLINPPASAAPLERTIMPGLSGKDISIGEIIAQIKSTEEGLWGDDVLQGFIADIVKMNKKFNDLDPSFDTQRSCSIGHIKDTHGTVIGYRMDFFLTKDAHLSYRLRKRPHSPAEDEVSIVEFGTKISGITVEKENDPEQDGFIRSGGAHKRSLELPSRAAQRRSMEGHTPIITAFATPVPVAQPHQASPSAPSKMATYQGVQYPIFKDDTGSEYISTRDGIVLVRR